MADLSIKVNGRTWPVDATPDTPLLWALRDHLGLKRPPNAFLTNHAAAAE